MEIPLFIRSIDGKGKLGNFTITVNPRLKLGPNKQHFLAMDQLNMSYWWHNVVSRFNNDKIKYSKDNGISIYTTILILTIFYVLL